MSDIDIEGLKAKAEKATPGEWTSAEGSTGYPECDDRDFWAVVLSPAGREIVTLHERYSMKEDDRVDYDFDAAFIAAANPSVTLALIAQRAELLEALRGFNVGGDQIVSLTDGFVTIRLPRPVVEAAAQAISRATQSTVSQDAGEKT